MFQVLLALVPVGAGARCAVRAGSAAAARGRVRDGAAVRSARAALAQARRRGPRCATAACSSRPCLLALSITPLLPWWLTVLGTGSRCCSASTLFGGLGQNPFNPAMVGYAVLLVAFPAEMTRWPVPLDADQPRLERPRSAHVSRRSTAATLGSPSWDGYTGATALDSIRSRARPALHAAGTARPRHDRRRRWARAASRGSTSRRSPGASTCSRAALVRWHIPVAVLGRLLLPAFVAQRARSRRAPRAAGAGLLGRDDARRVLHRDRPGLGRDQRPRPALVRRGHRVPRVDHPQLGRLPGRLRVRGAADEPRRAAASTATRCRGSMAAPRD